MIFDIDDAILREREVLCFIYQERELTTLLMKNLKNQTLIQTGG